MVTGVAGHHGVSVTLNADLENRLERGHVTIPRQVMEAKHALEVQTARKCANRSLVELVGKSSMTTRTSQNALSASVTRAMLRATPVAKVAERHPTLKGHCHDKAHVRS